MALAVDPSSSWDWGRLPSLLEEDHGSIVAASPHLTGVLAPSSRVPREDGKKRCRSWRRAAVLVSLVSTFPR